MIPDHLHATPRSWLATKQVESLPEPEQGKVMRWEPTDPEKPFAEGSVVLVDTPPPPVPQAVTPRQIRLALIDRAIMPEQITQMLEAIEDGAIRAKSLAEWGFATTVRRDHPLIAQLSAALEFSQEDVDELFREAAVL